MKLAVGLILTFLNLLFWPKITPTNSVTQSVTIEENADFIKDKNIYQTEVKILNRNKQPFSHCFITIYNQDKNYYPEYPFSILQTDDLGKVNFTLPRGNFFMVVSSDESQLIDDIRNISNFPHFLINKQLSLNDQKYSKIETINLTENHIIFKNIDHNIPRFKLEATVQVGDNQFTGSQSLANNFRNTPSLVFYTNPGTYNLNLDQKTFFPEDNVTYALSRFNFKTPQETNLTFDFNQLKTSTVAVKDISYGWLKLAASNIGDFQVMYLGKPFTFIKTNTPQLFLEMVYIPNQKCVTAAIKQKFDPISTLESCTDSDIRFDYTQNPTEAVYINQNLEIAPPSKLNVEIPSNTINSGDLLHINYSLSNSLNQKVTHVYIHKLWDQDIMPKHTIVNSAGQTVLVAFPFDNKPNSYFESKACLPADTYQINSSFPLLIWGQQKLLTSHQTLTINTGINQCQTENKSTPISQDFSSWEEIFQKRQSLYSQSTGYLQTFPSFNKGDIVKFDVARIKQVNNCSDFDKVGTEQATIINLDSKNVSDQQFQKCLQRYASQTKHHIFILRNSFTQDIFASQKSYIFYYYYLLIHQKNDHYVGIMADVFYDIFYGFPDFYFISSNLQNQFPHQGSISQIIDDYQSILDSKTIIYQ